MYQGQPPLRKPPELRPAFDWLQTGPTLAFLLLGGVYFIAADLGLALVAMPESVAVFWPASGLAAGVLIALGTRVWLPVTLAVAAATLAANLMSRANVGATLAFALCNALECLVAAVLVERLDPAGRRLENPRGVFTFILAAAAAAALAAAPAAFALRFFELSSASFTELWFVWFKSDAVGILVIAPLIITLASIWRDPPPVPAMAEGLAAVVLMGAATAYSFALASDAGGRPLIPPAALLFPLFLWLSSRLHPFFSAAAVLAFTLVISWTAFSGRGQLGNPSIPVTDRILSGQLAMLTVAMCGLTMAAAFTGRRNATLALATSEERLRIALAAAGSYAFDHDCATGLVHRVGGLLERLDLPDAGVISDYEERLHPEDRTSFSAMLQSLTREAPYGSQRYRLRTRDGSYIHVGHRVEARFDKAGKLTRLVGTCTDVTQRVGQEAAVREGEERLREALRAGRVFAFEWDVATQSVRRSENAAEILGVPAEKAQMSRVELLQHVPQEDLAALARDTAALSPANPVNRTRYRFRRHDGETVWLEVIEEGSFDAAGKLVRVRGLTRDVTALTQAEERQAKLIAELDHRVKNSLARMSAVVERSREGHTTVDGYVEALYGRIATMTRTHERLRLSSWSGVGLGSLVADEIAPYRTQRNASVEGSEVVLSPDAAQAVSLTLHELATNAAKHGAFSRDSGRVDVRWSLSTRADGGRVLRLCWHEQADWPVDTVPREGFGTRTIRNLLNFELGAAVRLEFTPQGVRCDIEIPAERAVV